MSVSKIRIKILKRIAQVQVESPPVAGSPSSIDINSFPTQIELAWGSNNLPNIQKLANIINNSLFFLGNGNLDLNRLKQQNFNVDTSIYYGDMSKIVLFAKLIYNKMFSNNGVGFKKELSVDEKKEIIDKLKSDTTFVSVPDGGLNNTLPSKIGGNFKSIVIDILNSIK